MTTDPVGTLTVTTEPATLDDVVENVPPGFGEFATQELSSTISDLPEGITLDPEPVSPPAPPVGEAQSALRVGMAALTLPQVRLAVSRTVEAGNIGVELKGHVYFQTGLELSRQSRGFGVGDWRLGVHADTDIGLDSDLYTTVLDKTFELPLPRVEKWFAVMIGPVPVAIKVETGPKIDLHLEAKVGVEASVKLVSSRSVGVQRTNGTVKGYQAATDTPVIEKPRPYASGTATLFGGLDGAIYAYGLTGPYFKMGHQVVAELKKSAGLPYTCSVYHRPVAEYGVKTSDVLEKLFGYSDKVAYSWDFPKKTLVDCDSTPVISKPVISTTTLPNATVGSPYAATLKTADNRNGTWSWLPPFVPPAWLTLNGNNGVLSGTPGADDVGTANLAVKFTDGGGKTATRTVALKIRNAGSGSDWIEISAPGSHTCGLRREGTVWCWGFSPYGGASAGGSTASPRKVGEHSDWTSVSTSGYHSCGLRMGGTAWCWGANGGGQLGDGTTTDRNTPIQVGTSSDWTVISVGPNQTCGLRGSGTAWCWGANAFGELGDGTSTSRSTPVQVGADGDWSAISAGAYHTCGLRRDGTGWCWGDNASGGLGDGTSTSSRLPVQVVGSDWSAISAGGTHTCGLRRDGTAWCWGSNGDGEIGDGTTTNRLLPVQVGGDNNWETISADRHTCGVRVDGSAWCWGPNNYGQLGDGTVTARSLTPTQVISGTDWTVISAAYDSTCGLWGDGTAWCWGRNYYGKLGDGTNINRSMPAQVH